VCVCVCVCVLLVFTLKDNERSVSTVLSTSEAAFFKGAWNTCLLCRVKQVYLLDKVNAALGRVE